jgi:hypothetical protein
MIHAGTEALPRRAYLHGFGSRPKSGYGATCERSIVFEWCFPCGENESASPHGRASIAETLSRTIVLLGDMADDLGEVI